MNKDGNGHIFPKDLGPLLPPALTISEPTEKRLISDRLKHSLNASSAALNALFRPKFGRSDSLPVSRALPEPEAVDADDGFMNEDLKDIIELLEEDSGSISHNSEIASTLHDLSLLSETGSLKKQNALKSKLLFALATPFMETILMTSSFLGSGGLEPSQSSIGLNLAGPQPTLAQGNRPFHSMSSGKHASPQSVITVDAEPSWNLKAANDLACLMFGISKNMIKNLTLLDLIAPQFRDFVLAKLTRVWGENDSKEILFAGEIIAIHNAADNDFKWTSVWAKRKNNMIIVMFEQIICDAFDATILCEKSLYPEIGYSIESMDETAGNLLTKCEAAGIRSLKSLSEGLEKLLRELSTSHKSTSNCDSQDSDLINRARYFTVHLDGMDNIPCALTSYPLEKNDDRYEIKLKIHLMPYIAGMFVVDFHSFEVLSCNKAIAKNLFGLSSEDINGGSINKIIPDFTEILDLGLADQAKPLDIVPGLVLPEHFFRKYHAWYHHKDSPNQAEQFFVSSRGIDGLHHDGKNFYVDVQLRVISSDVFVLWATYSRHLKKSITKQLDKLNKTPPISKNGSEFLLRSTRRRSFQSCRPELVPSDSEIIDLDSSPDVTRHNSTRRPKKANTFAVPVTYIRSDFDMSPGSNSHKSVATEDSSISSDLEVSSEKKRKSSEFKFSNKPYYKNHDEQEILDIENAELKKNAEASPNWPKEIGAKKRTKKFEEFRVLKKLGEGAYGKVVLVQHKEDKAYKVIIKCIDKQRILVDTWVRDRKLGTIPSEIQVMATLMKEPHPTIMRILDYFEDPDYYYLETPIFGNPPAIDLFDYIEVKKDLSELDCQLIFKQVVLAVYHLHKHGIVHRDIKDENLLVNEYGVVKLIDFGSAGYVRLGPFDVFVGTIDYASPEVLRGEKYEGKPQDIWALGILLYTMIYKENPFYNVDEIMEGDLRVPFVVSEQLISLIRSILVRDLEKRPTITDIAENPWLEV